MTWKLSKSSRKNRSGVDARLILISDRALEISPIDFGIPEYGGVRSASTQNKLYIEGLSECDGYIKISDHQLRKALDFFAYKHGSASWDEDVLAIVAAAHLQAANELGIKLGWGGLWKGYKDMPHLYLMD